MPARESGAGRRILGVIRRAVAAFLREEREARIAEAFGLWRGRRGIIVPCRR